MVSPNHLYEKITTNMPKQSHKSKSPVRVFPPTRLFPNKFIRTTHQRLLPTYFTHPIISFTSAIL